MNWLHYLIEANVYLAVFYAVYCAFLNKETYYTLNRIYLLVSCLVSFLLPVIQIGALKPAEPEAKTMVFITPISGAKPVVTHIPVSHITVQDMLIYAYLIGVIVLTVLLLFKLLRLLKMTRIANKVVNDQYKMVNIEDSNAAFSFFNYLFIGSKTVGSDVIIRHELVHIKQKHSADIIFLEVMKIVNWFNPFIYLLQISLKTVHEYIADEQTAAYETDALTYSSFLVNNAYGLSGPSVTHSFFNYNLLKKRIIMLNQKRSGNLARLKYLVAVPICAALLCVSTLGFSKTYGWVDLAPQHESTGKLADSSAKKLPQLYFPPPIVVKDGYGKLYEYMHKNVKYPKAELKNNKSGLVMVGFNITNNHTLSNTRIIKSGGAGFDAEVIKAFEAYTGSVTDKPGEHKLILTFYTNYYAQAAKYEATLKQPGYEFNMLIIGALRPVPPPPLPPMPSKKMTNVPPPPPPAPPTATKPKSKKNVHVVFPPPVVVPDKAPKVTDVKLMPPPPPPKDPFDSLYKYVSRHVRYPTSARDNLITGRVILNFNINNGKIEDLKITRGLYDVMDAEVVRVLKNFNGILSIKSGRYSIPVAFSLVDQDNNYVGKTPGYNTQTDDKNKPGTNNIVVESGPVYSLNEIVIVGYVNTKK